MPPKSNGSRTSSQGAGHTARVALAILAILLLLVNLGGWVAFIHLVRTQEQLLERGLQDSAAFVAGAIPDDNLFYLDVAWIPEEKRTDFASLEPYANLPSTESLLRSLAEVSQRGGENQNVAILSPDGYLVADAKQLYLEPIRPQFYTEDASLIAQAANNVPGYAGKKAVETIKRAYHPIITEDDRVIGVLRLEANWQEELPRPRMVRRLTFGAIAGAVLILMLWWMLSRLIRRAVQAERMADQSDRLRALGTATAGIAHEIRNPLGIIMLSIEEMRAMIGGSTDEKLKKDFPVVLDDLQDETKRLRDLTDQFLNFSREKPDEDGGTTDAAESVRQTVRLFQKGAPSTLAVEAHVPDESLPVQFGDRRLRQVLLNLLRNAQDALAGTEGAQVTVRVSAEKHHTVRIDVQDNGPGMDAATLAQVFDPFFTTRPEGTGLGLSLSRSIVEAAGGRLELESEKGKGCRAQITLQRVKN